MTRIVVLSECHFTRLGLAALLHPRYAVFSTTDCLALQSRLSSGATTALVILSVSGRETLPSLAECVRRLHRSQPHCAVLLDPGAVSTPLLRYYFNDLHGYVGVIDLAQPVAALHRFIEQVVSGQVTLSAEVIAGQSCLNGREREVLQTLMSPDVQPPGTQTP